MSGFVASPATIAAAAIADEIAGDGWYPALKISTFRAAARVGGTVTETRAREALLGGMISASVGLIRWRAEQESRGVVDLESATIRGTSGQRLGGEPLTVILWRRAVHAFASADLIETHGDISATESGRDRREVRAASADELRRDATVALRDLMARGRVKVALV